jgi:hypothetical protein
MVTETNIALKESLPSTTASGGHVPTRDVLGNDFVRDFVETVTDVVLADPLSGAGTLKVRLGDPPQILDANRIAGFSRTK